MPDQVFGLSAEGIRRTAETNRRVLGELPATGRRTRRVYPPGASSGGPAMVEFALEEVCCDTLTATASVTRILCSGGSGVELGDLIELIDSRQCHLIGANPEPSMWLGIKGVAIKMEFNISDYPAYSYVCDDLAPITGNNDCKWSILDLCNNGNFCA